MNGKDWFIVGTRLIAVGVLVLGFQETLTFLTRGMLLRGMYDPFLYMQDPALSYLLRGTAMIVFALILLRQAAGFADWCYRGDGPAPAPPDFRDGPEQDEGDYDGDEDGEEDDYGDYDDRRRGGAPAEREGGFPDMELGGRKPADPGR